MKGILPIAAGVLSLASAWTSPALAIDGLTANGAVATDYVFRGITQSAKRPAVQGGLDYSFGDSGFAAGTWVSSIDFGDNTNLEWDIFANYNFDLGPVGASMGVVGYVFPYSGIGGPYDFVEPNLGLEYDFGIFAWSARAFWAPSLPASYVTVRNGYHPDSEYFLTAGVSAPVVPWLAVGGNFGYQGLSDGKPPGVPDDSYTVWDIGATVTVDNFSLDLRYIDTSKHTFANYLDPQFATGPFYVATFGFKFP
jgi:uncharacterized protein (TIGR02001 family)